MSIGMLVLALLLSAESEKETDSDNEAVRHEKAAALMKMGVEFRRQGEHAEALRRFQLAHELAPSGQTMVQIGLAEQSLQRWGASEEHLSRGLLQSDAWVAKFRNVIDAALTTVRGHIGVLEITGPAGALVSVAGVSKGTLPIDEIRVNEGSTIVVIADHGSPPWSRVVTVRGGTRTTVMYARPVVASAPSAAAAVCPHQEMAKASAVATDQRWRDVVGGGLVGAGLVSVGFGSYALWKSESTAPGWVGVSVGGATILGGLLVLFSRDAGSGNKVAFGVTPAGIFARGRF
jgi:ABC-type Fe3+-siderophore transport system permease subunit